MTDPTSPATVVIVPGLREDVPDHWQAALARRLPRVRCVPPMGRENIDCAARVEALEREASAVDGPIVLVAHSAGVITVVHWVQVTRRAVRGALLAAPPDFETGLPAGYPTKGALQAAGWLPVPRAKLPFRSIIAASRNDPLASFERVAAMARNWGGRLDDLGEVGHLNPASGHSDWAGAEPRIGELDSVPTAVI